MIRLSEIKLPLDADDFALECAIYAILDLPASLIRTDQTPLTHFKIFKRSFDARKANVIQVFIVDVFFKDDQTQWIADFLSRHANHSHIQKTPDMRWIAPVFAPEHFAHSSNDENNERPIVIGFGPCGMFAALTLAQMGFKPIVLERGKTVRERTKDTWELWRKSVLNPESNVQFGEGGAGTFSDGKLYSQVKDPRFLSRKVMEELVKAGAPEEILIAAHPHIGTFKLVKVVENIRNQIIALGGEIRFQHRVEDLVLENYENHSDKSNVDIDNRSIVGLKVVDLVQNRTYVLPAQNVVLALGHSARDTFLMLFKQNVAMEAKPFSIGFRIEHPQNLIDRARFGKHAGNPLLGAADYKLVHHAKNERSVYSFCMCPGGTVVAATSEIGRVVTNGMSQYSRNERNANAGIVVGIHPSDFPNLQKNRVNFEWALGDSFQIDNEHHANLDFHPLSGLVLQRQLESNAYVLGGENYKAPAQLLKDFLKGGESKTLGNVEPSYKPGIHLTNLHRALPKYAIEAIQEALPVFGQKIKGFDLPDAVLTGVETRTSSPLKLPRDEHFQSTNTRGLYPAGEGASYAGGILSAAIDGIKVAESVALSYQFKKG